MPEECTLLTAEESNGLGELTFLHPPGTFALTPASLIALQAIAQNQNLLAAQAWTGGARWRSVAIAQENARLNGVAEKAEFFVEADSYEPRQAEQKRRMAALRGKIDFLIANPPSSETGDGFGYRRAILQGAREFLRDGAVVFLSVSFQYGPDRVRDLCARFPQFSFRRVLAATKWVPFDLARPDLLVCLELYAEEERKGGIPYLFPDRTKSDHTFLNARTVLARFFETGESPLTRWQSLLFDFRNGAEIRFLA